MRNFFGNNLATGKKTYAPFIERSASSGVSAKMQESEQAVTNANKAAQPAWLTIVSTISLAGATLTLSEILQTVDDVFGKAWFGIVLAIGVAGLVITVASFIYGIVRCNRVKRSPAFAAVMEEHEKAEKRCFDDLGVPENADDIDAFTFPFRYNRKGAERSANPIARYLNTKFKIFKRGDKLCLADVSDLTGIPLSSIITAVYVNKRASFSGWNKPLPRDAEPYKPYKIIESNTGAMSVKGYYSVTVLLNGEESEIIIPSYEGETLKKYVTVT